MDERTLSIEVVVKLTYRCAPWECKSQATETAELRFEDGAIVSEDIRALDRIVTSMFYDQWRELKAGG